MIYTRISVRGAFIAGAVFGLLVAAFALLKGSELMAPGFRFMTTIGFIIAGAVAAAIITLVYDYTANMFEKEQGNQE